MDLCGPSWFKDPWATLKKQQQRNIQPTCYWIHLLFNTITIFQRVVDLIGGCKQRSLQPSSPKVHISALVEASDHKIPARLWLSECIWLKTTQQWQTTRTQVLHSGIFLFATDAETHHNKTIQTEKWRHTTPPLPAPPSAPPPPSPLALLELGPHFNKASM